MNTEIRLAFRSAEMLQAERAWVLDNLAVPFVSVVTTRRTLNVRDFSANIARMGRAPAAQKLH